MNSGNNTVRSFFSIKLNRIYLTSFTLFTISYCCMGIAFASFSFLLLLFYAIIIVLTGVYYLVYKKAYKDSFNSIIAVFFSIYLIWFFLSVIHGNEMVFIFQDSVGFLFYLAYLPLSFILITFAYDSYYDNLICYIGLAAAVLHILLFGLYFMIMGTGELTDTDMRLFNSMLQNIGITKNLGGAYGLLRIDIGVGQLLLIPFAISVKNIIKSKTIMACKSQFAFAIVLILGAIFNGNRSLLITLALASGFLLIFSVRYHQITFQRLFRFGFAVVLLIAALLSVLSFTGLYDVSMLYDRMGSVFKFEQNDIGNEMRFGQISSLLNKISENPLMGSGFGAYTEVIRNDDRPFIYEVDYLAVLMKLGIIGAALYIGAYVAVLIKGYKLLRYNFDRSAPYVSAGAAYLFYMGTNGGFAMSLFSTLLHVMIMLGITSSYKCKTSPLNHAGCLADY